MALQSMTGFSRAAGSHAGIALAWEVKSVNGKGLELRLKLPPGFERLEPAARQAVQQRFARGNIQANLAIARAPVLAQPVVNEAFLKDLAGLARRLEEQFGVARASADGLLALRGVLETPESVDADDERAPLDAAILGVLSEALDGLAQARAREGEALAEHLRGHLDRIEQLTRAAEADPSRDAAAIRQRLAEQVRMLTEASAAFDEGRLHQEAAILATKADIREELDRLMTHVAAARALLASSGAVGRRLDFLAQEFNRESNTLCSKAGAASLTAIGLDLKAVVDQFREQVQNLE